MNVIYSSVKDYVSNVFHQDSGSGAIDVVAVEQPDGALRCSPFHVHFGSLHKLKPEERRQVTLEVNGQVVDHVRMKLGAAGGLLRPPGARARRREGLPGVAAAEPHQQHRRRAGAAGAGRALHDCCGQ